MKRIIAFILLTVLAVSVSCVSGNAGAARILPGDLNGDGRVTVTDALKALRISLKLIEEANEMTDKGDMNGDGKITMADVTEILKTAAKIPTKEELAARAEDECCAGVRPDSDDMPFWNIASNQFMYAPAFSFGAVPSTSAYRYTATDANGAEHTFEASGPAASLSPIWREIPEGVVQLDVYALYRNGTVKTKAGSRTFFKLASFPADLPGEARTYSEAVGKGYGYIMNQNFMRYWLEKGKPDPSYDLNVYPSKMISAIINSMITYCGLYPRQARYGKKTATNAADYMLSITPASGPTEGLPPTYYIDFRPNPGNQNNLAAGAKINQIMMIYPAHMGTAYLNLYRYTGTQKYLDAAMKIAEYYRDHVQPNGSWYLIIDSRTGEPLVSNYCEPLERIIPFLMEVYEETGEEIWKTLSDNALAFDERERIAIYNWEGQFEDGSASALYQNMTHYGADAVIRYYCKHYSDDEEKMRTAAELMRFVEDQFVVWTNASPWNITGFDTTQYRTPCGYEQYGWYVPIDASTSDIMSAFLAMYDATKDRLYLEKAKALADSITRVQQPSGMIPTHWISNWYVVDGNDFWVNCMFHTLNYLSEISDYLGE